MKRLILIIALGILGCAAKAQWVSPGTGHAYTLDELVAVSNGTVTMQSPSIYNVNGDLTIAESDTLLIGTANNLSITDQTLITIKGSMICLESNEPEPNSVSGKDGGVYNWLFENASHNYLWNIHFSDCGGIKLMESEITFQDCEFAGFTTQYCSNAIDYFQCNPRIIHCSFHDNEGPAIGSAVNIQGSPEIVNCTLYNNVTANVNKPQINIGPSGENPIRIEGNRIEGVASDMVGGIAITNLSSETAKAIITGNIILSNRYGYTQMGYGFDVEFTDNDVIDNNLETNPMNGGSGLSIYGMNNDCKIKMRRNHITGNLWGITAISACDIDLGTESDPGDNAIYGNGNGGTRYELYNNSSSDITAIGNYWGSNDPDEVEELIVHQPDQASLGLVTYLPIKELHPVMLDFVLLAEDNPPLQNDYQGTIDQENHSVTVELTEDCDLSDVVVRYRADIGVSGSPASGEHLDFATPVTITLSTYHGESQAYIVTISKPESIEETTSSIKAFPNPSQGDITLEFPEKEACVEIFNTLGQSVLTIENHLSGNRLDLSTLQAGTYFVTLSRGNKILSKTTIILAK
ncbi:MAG: T9SS type A sorting domain-containing protein [Bacteroidales bacterium]|nr:T9SS type A sorting domain-containing protein [Bacteroidales bacterium]